MDQSEFIEQQKAINKLTALVRKGATIKDCSHPSKEECKPPIKSAHSLQRQGSLKHLEKTINNNAFIYSHTDRQINKKYGFLDLKPIGRKDASTFFGFCEFHDTELFKEVENDPEATDIENDMHCFLHTYRSFSHSYHRKYEEYKLFTSEEKEVVEHFNKTYGKDKEDIVKGVKLALEDLEIPKKRIDDLLLNKKYDGLRYYCYEYSYRCPVACSGVTTPGHFKNGEPFNLSENSNNKYSDIFTTVLPLKDRTVIILAAFPEDELAIKYLDELDTVSDDLEFEKYLSFHIINNLENVYISPYFYDRKDYKWRQSYCELINIISNKYTPYIRFNKRFPINYFAKTESIRSELT
ncbi:hypothetical protein [Chryseobacterium sp. JM1]|uniref:hypothetical protein n=1 Tax=Chryseobacterium sp. JM1 TaxID=1233950 RepID=UPI0004E7781B|nr:hypothetical protein [Chryseobacterium sp. JM1]KFF15744.1 hypothetical protein IW22_23810 [Chryseobacterium sp. JM1]